MKDNKLSNYIVFWLSQSISQLGSSMTGFALIIWAYKQTNSPMSMSLMSFCSYLPYILISILAGTFVDTHKKKTIMLCSDTIAAICTAMVFVLLSIGKLEIYHIYIVNCITGFMNAFQSPASSVAIGIMIPKEKYEKVSGMNSFSNSLLTVVTPMLATLIHSIWGLKGVIVIDFITFVFAFLVLAFLIDIPEKRKQEGTEKKSIIKGAKEGVVFLKQNKGIWYLIVSMTVLNFFSRLGYENILPAMILARSGGNEHILGIVSGFLGFGGIIGSLMVTFIKFPKNKIKVIYFSGTFSFLVGDLLMGLGRDCFIWCISAISTCILIPYINAGINAIVYSRIPTEVQGRVFAVRNTVQYCTIPIGILLGGLLAEYIFEPFMNSKTIFALFLQKFVGEGKGSGMAVMFLLTGVLGALSSLFWYNNSSIKNLEKD